MIACACAQPDSQSGGLSRKSAPDRTSGAAHYHNKPYNHFGLRVLGRSLDQLYEAGVTQVFAQVAGRALAVYGIRHRFYHLDSSSFHLHGQYLAEAPEEAIEITYGYSKDHRPDCQVLKYVYIRKKKELYHKKN